MIKKLISFLRQSWFKLGTLILITILIAQLNAIYYALVNIKLEERDASTHWSERYYKAKLCDEDIGDALDKLGCLGR